MQADNDFTGIRISQRIKFRRPALKVRGIAYFLTLECFLQRDSSHDRVVVFLMRRPDGAQDRTSVPADCHCYWAIASE
jgi:hypothetical protein